MTQAVPSLTPRLLYPSLVVAGCLLFGQAYAANGIAEWELEESSGTTASDSINGYDGTYQGGVTLGQPGSSPTDTAAYFDGVDDFVQISANDAFSLAEGTIELWFNADSALDTQTLLFQDFDQDPWAGYGSLRIGIDNGSVYSTIFPALSEEYSVSTSINSQEWHHLAFTFDTSGIQLYLDGVIADSLSTYTLGLVGDGSAASFQDTLIGAHYELFNPGATTDHFQGSIGGVSYWDTSMSAEEVLAAAGAGPSAEVPEPSTYLILGSTLLVAARARSRKRRT